MVEQIVNPVIPLEYLVLIALVLVATAGYLAWRTAAGCGRAKRALLLGLRVVGVLAVTALAADPGRWVDRSPDTQREIAVLVDRSASMATADVDARSRWHAAVDSATGLHDEQTAELPVSLYAFGGEATPAGPDDLAAMSPDAPLTDIPAAGAGS